MQEASQALADPTRRRILTYLRRGERTAGEMAEYAGKSRTVLAHHLTVLKGADLVRVESLACSSRWRPRYHERRATGRKQASPGLVVCGSVRIVASVASRLHSFSGPELCPTDFTQWRALRSELNHRHEAHRLQYRFLKSPEQYLAVLEEKLSKERLPP
jgi:DNA-binding transcriptional ArsR family regulator